MDERDTPIGEPCPECGADEVSKAINKTVMGVDAKVKTPSWFKDKMDSMKEYTPKRFHNNLDRAANRSGGRLGPQ